MDWEEVTISASRGDGPLTQIWPRLLPATGPHMASALALWLGGTSVMGTAAGSGWRGSRTEAGSGWAVWFGNLALPPEEGGVNHRRHGAACGCGAACWQREMRADRGFMVVPSYPPLP